jgi:hypothetical protein
MAMAMAGGAGERVVPDATAEPRRGLRWLPRAPGPVFHAVLAVGSLGLLWADSSPGTEELWWYAVPLLACLVLVWAGRLVHWLLLVVHRRPHGRGRAFLVAPTVGLAVLILAGSGLPVSLRWSAVGHRGLDRAIASAERAGVAEVGDDGRIGTYDVSLMRRYGRAWVVWLHTSELGLCAAGFVHVPRGAWADVRPVFADPEYRSLGDRWYEFTDCD